MFNFKKMTTLILLFFLSFHFTFANNTPDIIDKLYDYIFAIQDSSKDTAKKEKLYQEFEKFLSQNKVNLNFCDMGAPILEFVEPDIELMEFLINHGADVNFIGKGKYCKPVIFFSLSYSGDKKLLKRKLEKGEISKEEFDKEMKKVVERNIKVIRFLVSKGAKLEYKKKVEQYRSKLLDTVIPAHIERNTILHEVAKEVIDEYGLPLLEEVYKVASKYLNEKNDKGETPIMIAAKRANIEAILFFLNKGANVKIRDNEGRNILHLLFGSDDILSPYTQEEFDRLDKVVSILLKKGLNINSKDSEGKTPIMYVVKSVFVPTYKKKHYSNTSYPREQTSRLKMNMVGLFFTMQLMVETKT